MDGALLPAFEPTDEELLKPAPEPQNIIGITSYNQLIDRLATDRANLGVCSIQLAKLQEAVRARDEILANRKTGNRIN